MSLRISEIHPAETPGALNTEWFVIENNGDKPFNTRNCALGVRVRGKKRPRTLGSFDPGFALAPGESRRVLSGTLGRKAHGKAPAEDGTKNYNLFLNSPIVTRPGTTLVISLRAVELATARFDPESESGVADPTA